VKLEPRAYDVAGLPLRYMNPGELPVLLHLLEMADPGVVIEFGVNRGRNAAAALRNIPGIRHYVGVDVDASYRPHLLNAQRGEIPTHPGDLVAGDARFTLIVKPHDTFDLVPADLPAADAVFIDADHSRAGVEHDYGLACRVLRPGGIVIFHDDNGLAEVQVTETLNDLCDGGADIRHVDGTWLAFEVRPGKAEP